MKLWLILNKLDYFRLVVFIFCPSFTFLVILGYFRARLVLNNFLVGLSRFGLCCVILALLSTYVKFGCLWTNLIILGHFRSDRLVFRQIWLTFGCFINNFDQVLPNFFLSFYSTFWSFLAILVIYNQIRVNLPESYRHLNRTTPYFTNYR